MYPSVTAASLTKRTCTNSPGGVCKNYSTSSAKGSENAMSPTAKKPLITKVMMKKRILFCNIYKHWTMADWGKVMFCDKSTSRLARGGYNLVRMPSRVSKYDSRYNNKMVKHPKSVMV